MNSSGHDLLVDAERRFMNKLSKAMVPVMMEAFWELFGEAKKNSRTACMGVFQVLLRKIKCEWTDVIIKQHVDAILKEQPMFPKLLASVFIIHVKILSSIRTNNQTKKISISLPGNNLFIHSCYIKAANLIYNGNQQGDTLFTDNISDAVRAERLRCLLTNAIRETVEDLIPFDEIMTTYLPADQSGVMLGDDDEEAAEPEPEPDCEPEAAPECDMVQEAEAKEEPSDTAETPGGHLEKPVEVNPTKSIPILPGGGGGGDDELFSDVPHDAMRDFRAPPRYHLPHKNPPRQ